MAIKKVVLLFCVLLSANAWAGPMEHCPKIADIKEVGVGTYTAPTVGGTGDWYGTSQTGRGAVGRFEEAIFKAHGEPKKGAVVGELLHCGYALRDGGKLDMRFKQEGTVVSIKAGKVWEQWYNQYYCEDKAEGACTFKELVRPGKG
ncbi:Protein of unknown function [Pseudomonas sp. ok272]|uniref:DUF3757 domain-containing protein n=1 Tax=unclassified Pseudomonas TaxID=196821 RepID=UPI0008D7C04F|nr:MULTISPECIES: DUF3757 domain-containing protein [unclassified Pseudomonas]SEM32556.1 Protein of unknown function [Pseudomonas sp. ok272]SFM32468.1 Protein of unknown function [Pseudomonas sp. ok602]